MKAFFQVISLPPPSPPRNTLLQFTLFFFYFSSFLSFPSISYLTKNSSQTISSFSILFPSLLLPSTTLAQDRPNVIFSSYTAFGCISLGSVGRIETRTPPPGSCVTLPFFNSFQARLGEEPCPGNTRPEVFAYSGIECTGQMVSAGRLPPDGSDGDCQEIFVRVGTSLDSIGGRSVSFRCVDFFWWRWGRSSEERRG